jgi:hypothetical protein
MVGPSEDLLDLDVQCGGEPESGGNERLPLSRVDLPERVEPEADLAGEIGERDAAPRAQRAEA